MRNLIPDLRQLGFSKTGKNRGLVDASVLFVDISGFTNMTRSLMSLGRDGAEILSLFMSKIFTPLIDSVYNQNGFILNFAGDAFTAVFKGDNGRTAITAALNIRKFFLENPSLSHKDQTFKISVKSGVSVGKFNWIAAMGKDIRCFLFFGDVVDEAAAAEHNCVGNEICIDDKVAALLKNEFVYHIKNGAYFVDSLNFIEERIPIFIEPSIDDLKTFIPDCILEQKIIGEFREVVSLFISYKVSKELDEIEQTLEYLANYVQKYGGYVSGFDSGDKGSTLLALFGAPVSYEDNLERAVNCAAEIRKNCSIELRSGITEGVVYAGFVGSSKRSAYTALGDDVNLSARIMMKARFGADWIAGKAADKIKTIFELQSVGDFAFKGIDVPIEVFEIKGRLKVKTEKSFTTAFTGREEELNALTSLLEKCMSDKQLYCCTIYGEAGVGKSRLIYEVEKRAEGNFTLLNLTADVILRQSMNMFNSFFQRFFNQSENVSPDSNRLNFEKVWASLAAKITNKKENFEALKSYIAALAGIFWEGSVYDILDAKNRYENTMFAVADFFAAMAEIQPLMVVLDNMHAVDDDSLATLKTIVKKLSDYPVVLYPMSRLNDDGSKPKIFNNQNERFTFMVMDKLLEADVPVFVKNLLGGESNEELNNFVFSRTEGNPFFMEQLTLYMKDKNCLQKIGNSYALKVDKIEIPSEVNSLIVSRLDRLSIRLKNLVFRASVLGNNVDLLVLSEISDDKNIVNLLQEGVKEQLWGEASALLYSFRHALLRDTAYSMQLKARLKEIHRKVAVAIENHYSGDEKFFSSLAFHFGKAEEREREIYYLRKAADYAKAQYHNKEAEKMYEKLHGMLTRDEDLIEVEHLLGNVYKIMGEWDVAEKTFRKSLERAQKIDDKLLMARSMKELAYMLLEKGRYDESQPLLDTAVELYRRLSNVRGESDVEGYRGLIHYYKGELDDAVEHFTKKLELAEIIDDKVAKSLSYRYLGGVAYYRSDYPAALNYYKTQLDISKKIENFLDVAVAENNLGLVYSHVNDFANAAKFYGRALETYKKVGVRQYICYTSNNLGELKFLLGEYDEAKLLFEDQLAIATELGITRHVAIAYLMLGNVEKKQKHFDEALAYYNKAVAIAKELNTQSILCEFLYENAALFYEMERFDDALNLAEEALKISKQVNRSDYSFKSSLLKWKIISKTDRQKAVQKILEMISDNETKEENLAEIYFELYVITREQSYCEKALKIFESYYKDAPRAAYKEKIEILRRGKRV